MITNRSTVTYNYLLTSIPQNDFITQNSHEKLMQAYDANLDVPRGCQWHENHQNKVKRRLHYIDTDIFFHTLKQPSFNAENYAAQFKGKDAVFLMVNAHGGLICANKLTTFLSSIPENLPVIFVECRMDANIPANEKIQADAKKLFQKYSRPAVLYKQVDINKQNEVNDLFENWQCHFLQESEILLRKLHGLLSIILGNDNTWTKLAENQEKRFKPQTIPACQPFLCTTAMAISDIKNALKCLIEYGKDNYAGNLQLLHHFFYGRSFKENTFYEICSKLDVDSNNNLKDNIGRLEVEFGYFLTDNKSEQKVSLKTEVALTDIIQEAHIRLPSRQMF
jgi:hypothetical protein